MKSALILHAWLNGPDAHWYPWLKNELQKLDYQVSLPEIPTMNTKLPSLSKQMNFIKKRIPLDENFVVIGHSLGALLGLRLAEKFKFKKLILVAGWDFNDLTEEHRLFWRNRINHQTIKQNVKQIYCISSDNDPYYTACLANEMCTRLAGKFLLIKGAGHFTKKDGIDSLPQIIKYI